MNPAIGLCGDCQHCRIVNGERSEFYLCRLSFTSPEYRKYPSLPVLRCAGYRRRVPGEAEPSGLSAVEGSSDKLTE